MRLHKTKAYTSAAGKDYFSWKVSLPPEAIERLGWKDGDELEATTRGESLVLRRSR